VRSAYDKDWEPGTYVEIPAAIRKQRFEVFSGGMHRVVKGRDLMRRWWSWRRETDEFEGQGSLEQAKVAITEFTVILKSDLEPRLREDQKLSPADW